MARRWFDVRTMNGNDRGGIAADSVRERFANDCRTAIPLELLGRGLRLAGQPDCAGGIATEQATEATPACSSCRGETAKVSIAQMARRHRWHVAWPFAGT